MPADGQSCYCPRGPHCQEGTDVGQAPSGTSQGGQAGGQALRLADPSPSLQISTDYICLGCRSVLQDP